MYEVEKVNDALNKVKDHLEDNFQDLRQTFITLEYDDYERASILERKIDNDKLMEEVAELEKEINKMRSYIAAQDKTLEAIRLISAVVCVE